VQNQVEHEGNMEDQTLFYVPDSAAFVFTHSLRGTKGSDASNIYDEEINDDVFRTLSLFSYWFRNENSQMMKQRSSIGAI